MSLFQIGRPRKKCGNRRKKRSAITPSKRTKSDVGYGPSRIPDIENDRDLGVFANVDIPSGAVVAGADYVGSIKILTEKERKDIDPKYTRAFTNGQLAVVVESSRRITSQIGNLINAPPPGIRANVKATMRRGAMVHVATRRIKKHEELLVNYNNSTKHGF